MRLIDADNIKQDTKISELDYSIVKNWLDKQDTIDAQPVVHAKWVKMSDRNCYWYGCSKCKEEIQKNKWGQDDFSLFCPHCGAIMDGE